MSKPELHVVSFSGGKDSTAMLLRMLEEGMRVDMILFCDTGLEFPALYDHIKKVEAYTGRTVTVIRAEESFEYYFKDHKLKRGRKPKFAEKYGTDRDGYGWAGPKMRWCTQKLKTTPREKFLRPLYKQYEVIEYVGIAADELLRLERKNNQRTNCHHPLVDWGMTEADCLQYCYDRGFDWDGLYKIFSRVSCWCCPLQALPELRSLYKHFPELWEKLKYWDSLTWRKFRADYSVKELERRFAFEEEWQKAGKPLHGKAFYTALKKHMEETENDE